MCAFVHVLASVDRGVGTHTYTHGWNKLEMVTVICYANSCIMNQVLLCLSERKLTRWCPVLCPTQGGPLRRAGLNPHYINQAYIHTHTHAQQAHKTRVLPHTSHFLL